MAQDWAESTRESSNYGSFINEFPPDSIRSMRQLEWTYTKMCGQKMSIYIYIYIYQVKLNKYYAIVNLFQHTLVRIVSSDGEQFQWMITAIPRKESLSYVKHLKIYT